MAGTQMSLGQHLPSHCDEVVNLVDGLSIKGAAVRRQQAIEHALLIGKPGIKMDPKTDTAGSSIQNLALPVPDGRNGEDKEITNGVSSINNQDVNAEIASVSEQLNTIQVRLLSLLNRVTLVELQAAAWLPFCRWSRAGRMEEASHSLQLASDTSTCNIRPLG